MRLTPITARLDATFGRYRDARMRMERNFTRETAEECRAAYREFLRANMSADERAYFDGASTAAKRNA